MYVVTFYSYQGGVGRTTALVNVAADLAMRGRKVLLVDFDLAKPALSSFGPLGPDGPRPGLVEFIAEYLHVGRAPALEEYVFQAKIDEAADCQVWVMPAGRTDDKYWEALARLDWQNLYSVREGFLFMEDLKAQWRDILKADYVLIDAASGITDTTGVCTRQLADDVVILLVPDESDLAGADRVMGEVFAESIAEGPRRIDIHFVTSKVPDLDGDELPGARQLSAILEPDWAISATTGVGVIFDLAAELPHDPALLRGRQVVMSQRPRSRLAHQYRQLANAIILGNCTQDREGAQAFLKELQMHPGQVVGEVDQGDTEEKWFDSTRRLDQIIERFTAKHDEHDRLLDPATAGRDAEVLGQAASCLFLAGSRVRAAEILSVALEQSPTNSALLWQQASYRLKVGNRHFVEDLMTLLGPPADQTPPSVPELTEEEILRRIGLFKAESQLPGLDTEPLRHDVLPLEWVAGIDSYVVSAVRLLHRRAPEQLEEALQRRYVRNLSQADRGRLLSEEVAESMYPDQGPDWLIRWKHFREVIARLGPAVRGADKPDVASAFHLAMAYWAIGQEDEATQISREFLQPFVAGGSQRLLDFFKPTAMYMLLLQMFALLAFRADNLELAKTLVSRLVGDLGEQFQGTRFFSYWRYRPVRFSQFREDCRDLRQMIQQRIANVPISPPRFYRRRATAQYRLTKHNNSTQQMFAARVVQGDARGVSS